MDLIPADYNYLGLKLLKNPFWKFSATTVKSLGKKTTSKNSLMKKYTSAFNLIVLNTTKFPNSFHGQTSLKDNIFSVMISEVKIFLSG